MLGTLGRVLGGFTPREMRVPQGLFDEESPSSATNIKGSLHDLIEVAIVSLKWLF